MRILLTGAGGMLGHDVRARAEAYGHEISARSHAELDITDRSAVEQAVAQAAPEVVINCAAFTNVDGAEETPDLAQAINGDGAGHVAAAADAAGAWTVHVSTDYVFAGDGARPYLESDPVGPRSEYGRSKLAGERAVAAAAPDRHTVVRTAWLFGVAGPCFPATILRLAGERPQLSVVSDQIGCPTFTGHLAGALVELAERQPLGVVHVAAAEHCSWFDFAREIVRLSGAASEVRPVSTAEMPRPAPRPAWSVLASERADVPRLPAWRDGLEEYMDLRQRVS